MFNSYRLMPDASGHPESEVKDGQTLMACRIPVNRVVFIRYRTCMRFRGQAFSALLTENDAQQRSEDAEDAADGRAHGRDDDIVPPLRLLFQLGVT